MKINKSNRIWFVLTGMVIIALSCGPTGIQAVATPTSANQPASGSQTPSNPNAQGGSSRTQLISATVQIYGLQKQNGKLTPIYSGSGTIISPTGLILTNAHVASPASQGNTSEEPDALAVGLIDAEDKPPVFLYFAKVKAVDGYLDLAVIQVTTTLDGADVTPASLNLPSVQLGNSDNLHVGDHISIYGFPGIGGETITFTSGSVSGFTSEQSLGDRAWIKTDATIAGGNSGGLAANDAGYIVGVPTSASAGTGGNVTDCRVIQDTNGDGVIDSRDTCIPIGGFINGLRPVNLALPLIRAAQSGQEYASPYGGPGPSGAAGSGNETFGKISWYTGTGGADCKLKDPVSSFPSNTDSVAAAFDFSGMTDGEPAAEKWTVDGQELYSNQYDWNLGNQGHTFTCLYNGQDPMPNGNYHLELYAGQNLSLLAQADVVVGGSGGNAPAPGPSSAGSGVYLFGQVTDANSKKPLAGAEIYVLNQGLKIAQWKADNYADADILTSAKADAKGNYLLPAKLDLNVGYTVIVYAEGYPITYGEDLVWTAKDPALYQMDFSLTN